MSISPYIYSSTGKEEVEVPITPSLTQTIFLPYPRVRDSWGKKLEGSPNLLAFTGKERDEETGFTYHGARYFDAALLTGWMAVDPMSDKYPSLSPYNYCAWNPVIHIDPDGKRKWPIGSEYKGAVRKIVSGFFRNQTGKIHGAVDLVHRPISGPPNLEGGTIYATHDGVVEISGTSKSAGNWIVIRNGNIRTKYMHMQNVSQYKAGDYVLENTPIGTIGNTGHSEGPHLHYQLEQQNPDTKKWEKINPVEGDIPKVNQSMDVDLKDPQKMIEKRDNVSRRVLLDEITVKAS